MIFIEKQKDTFKIISKENELILSENKFKIIIDSLGYLLNCWHVWEGRVSERYQPFMFNLTKTYGKMLILQQLVKVESKFELDDADLNNLISGIHESIQINGYDEGYENLYNLLKTDENTLEKIIIELKSLIPLN
jgi:hypothetical protein